MDSPKLIRENEKLKRQLAASQQVGLSNPDCTKEKLIAFQKVATLQNALQAFVDDKDPVESLNSSDSEESESDADTEDNDDLEADVEDDDQEEEEYDPNDAIWDGKDSVYRCPRCGFEVLEGECQNGDCAERLNWTKVRLMIPFKLMFLDIFNLLSATR